MESKEELARLYPGKLYKVIFHTKEYFESTERKCFYPWVEVCEVVNSVLAEKHIDNNVVDHIRGGQSPRALPHPPSHQPVFVHYIQGKLS